jgi:hypothetical protein
MTRRDWYLVGGAVLVMEALLIPNHGIGAAWLPLVAGIAIARDLHAIHQRELEGEGRYPGGLRLITGRGPNVKPAKLLADSEGPYLRSRRLRHSS